MDKHIIIPRKPFTIVLRCPACGTKLQPPTRHSCGEAEHRYQAGTGVPMQLQPATALPLALLEDLSAIAEYLREEGDGRIVSAALGMVA
jgi:hypothetical protein